jgi:hypothetical protein
MYTTTSQVQLFRKLTDFYYIISPYSFYQLTIFCNKSSSRQYTMAEKKLCELINNVRKNINANDIMLLMRTP